MKVPNVEGVTATKKGNMTTLFGKKDKVDKCIKDLQFEHY